MQRSIVIAAAVSMLLALSACTNPYDPGQRAVGGGLLGAGTGAAIGGIAGGGRGAVAGALIGGAIVGGAATTPRPPPPAYYAPPPPGYLGGGEATGDKQRTGAAISTKEGPGGSAQALVCKCAY